jgi:hypothetical protein
MSPCIVLITTFFNRKPSVLDSLMSFKEISNSNSPVRLERVAKVPSVFSKKILWFVNVNNPFFRLSSEQSS